MYNINILLDAGLCNQLFMIFATVSYALDNGINYFIYSNKNNNKMKYWNTLLDRFNNKLIYEIDTTLPLYDEKENHHYIKIPSIEEIKNSFNLKGYYQSDKYFKHNYDKILEIMDFDNKQNKIKEEYNYLFKKKTIAIHFRIGDYIGLQQYHPILQEDYYNNALIYLEIKLKNIKTDYDILYFCQEGDKIIVDKMISNLNKDRDFNFIKVSDDIDDWKQLLIMSLCDNFIIANSTYSWFGAYFSKNIEKIIIYPSKWFGESLKHKNTKDICPDNWMKIIV